MHIEIAEFRKQLKKQVQHTAKYRKRIQRIRKGPASPQAQVNKLLRQYPNANVKRALLFHTVFVEQIKADTQNKRVTG